MVVYTRVSVSLISCKRARKPAGLDLGPTLGLVFAVSEMIPFQIKTHFKVLGVVRTSRRVSEGAS